MTSEVIEFDEFALDLARFELRYGDRPVPVERQVFDLLVYLVKARGRVVTKEELLDNVWGTRFVTESALTTQIKFARRALGDDGTRQRYIRTVHRRGYEFVAGEAETDRAAQPARSVGPNRRLRGRLTGPLVGREAAVADVDDLLGDQRLVTLVGPGGVGKTQLALAVADLVAERFPDGIIQIDLASIADPGELTRAAAEASGLGLRAGTAVADALGETRALVVIDNCEHLIEAVADFVDRLLADPTDPVRVLATSREPIGISGERVYPIAPLGITSPTGQLSPAARLFLERAGPTARDLDPGAVEEIVQIVDGLPLAIELAAAQLGFMSLTELRDRLSNHRLALEHHRRRPTRQDSLAKSVAWSWQLLDDAERCALTELSAFPADFGLDAVERVLTGPDPISQLRGLHAKSLVAATSVGDGPSRFRLLFGVRDFVRPHQDDLVGGAAGLEHRLAEAYATWFDEWSFEDQWTATEFVDVTLAERTTTRAILATVDPASAMAVARVAASSAALHRYGIGVAEGRASVRYLDLDALPDDLAARVALAAAEASYAFGDVAEKDRLADLALHRATACERDDIRSIALSQRCVGKMLIEPQRCVALLDEAVELAHKADTPRIESLALGLSAFCDLVTGDGSDAGEARIDEAERLAAPSGWDRISATTVRAITRFLHGDRAGAAADFAVLAEAIDLLGLSAAAALFRLLEVTCVADTASSDEIREVVERFVREFRRATGHAGHADALLLFAHRAVLAGDLDEAGAVLASLRGRRLAHQVSMLILDNVATRAGAPPVDFGVPSVVSPQTIPQMGELLDRELAHLT